MQSGSQHLRMLEDLITTYIVAESRISDAVLAAIAIEHGADLASTDRDFRRFGTLRWIDPPAKR